MDDTNEFRNEIEQDDEDFEAYDIDEKLRASIWYTTSKLCEQEELRIGCRTTRNFKQVLGDIMFAQAQQMAKDLEAFAKHAKRSTVSTEDVKLCARRNDHLFDVLNEYILNLENEKQERSENPSKSSLKKKRSNKD